MNRKTYDLSIRLHQSWRFNIRSIIKIITSIGGENLIKYDLLTDEQQRILTGITEVKKIDSKKYHVIQQKFIDYWLDRDVDFEKLSQGSKEFNFMIARSIISEKITHPYSIN